jgi:UDP-N-acetylglucosamine--N-acetylmuramyl-(pentapeptide) pyrophosphoryl-undecaprenol N-acetylglucosamine transferase
MPVTVMITTGGTGGHVFPGLAVADRLVARGAEVFWLGTRDGMEAKLVPQHGLAFEALDFRGVRGKGLRTALLGPFALAAACFASVKILRRRKPDVILGCGGFASFPGALMGVATGRPLALQEQNAVPGLANRILAYGADRLLTGFPNAFAGKHARIAEFTGNPLRGDIVAIAPPAERFAGRTGPLRLLVVGGSLGARALNELVPAALATLPEATRPQVVHQAGARHVADLRAAYARHAVAGECLPFIDDMAARYAWADFVVCRGGALTVAELAAVGLGALIVPLPGAIADEQSANAKWLVDAGGAFRITQDELDAAKLAALLANLNRVQTLAMAEAARGISRRDAADRIAAACLELAR